jgi:4-alpha-glucanotransferase
MHDDEHAEAGRRRAEKRRADADGTQALIFFGRGRVVNAPLQSPFLSTLCFGLINCSGFAWGDNVPSYEELLNELSELCGIVPEYWDIFGARHAAPAETKKSILQSMGLRTATQDDLVAEIQKKRDRPWNIFIEPVKVILFTEQPLVLTVHVPVREGEELSIAFKCTLEDERGHTDTFSFLHPDVEIADRRLVDGIHHLKVDVPLNIVKEMGYYTLDFFYMSSGFGLSGTSKVIITPEICHLPAQPEPVSPDGMGQPDHLNKTKTWGTSINLYALRSEKNWGIGDFTDLSRIVEWTADLGGGFVGINPLHVITNNRPLGISPYSPISRLYKNPVYLDVTAVPDVAESSTAPDLIDSDGFQSRVRALKNSMLVDYKNAASIKVTVLQLAFDSFYETHVIKSSPRGREFESYVRSEGKLLEDFALFTAIQEKTGIASWRDWPAEYRDISSPEVETFRKDNEPEILFHQYVQWLIDGQHQEVAERARQLGMPVGLYHDLAVGSSGDGFDAWIGKDIIAKGIDVGAPPDDFNPSGQNWGFPPFDPEKMRRSGYEFMVQTLRKNMLHAGALRIDHALGMFRLFWIPQGAKPYQGAYVHYASEDILRIIALESIRNRTIVIAEDLGTVGEDVRETLARFRMLSYKVLYFERNYPDPSFKIPERYTDLALCTVTTHDLPTICGYWAGRDIQEKTKLGLYPNDELRQRQIQERERDRGLLLQALKSQGLLPDNFSTDPSSLCIMIPSLCLTIYEYLSLTPSRLLAVSLDDIIGTMDQQNMPNTVDTYPNWRRKTPESLEKIMSGRSFLALSKIFKRNHR